MYKEKSVAVVVPCYNEGTQIGIVINTMPEYVDYIVIVDDKSKDNTVDCIKDFQKTNKKIVLVCHEKNQGVGGAIASGYKWCRDNNIDCTAVMAGDAQMDPDDLPNLLDPVVAGEVDYAKGNRLISGDAWEKIPRVRYLGNSGLSFMTKIASGYWHVTDSQTGYTVINHKALKRIDWDHMYKRYGQPNDLLVRLNVYSFRVRDIEIKPVYGVGEKSGIKIRKVLFTIPKLLLKMFLWRMKEKYIIRDFHPLVFFYFMGLLLFIADAALLVRLIALKIMDGFFPPTTLLLFVFVTIMAFQSVFFAMWFDMEYNKELK